MLRYILITFNVILLTYLVWDSFSVIAIHQAEGVSSIFGYLIRGFVILIPLITLISVIYPKKLRVMYVATVLNSLIVMATFFGYYVVLFEGVYKFQAIYIILIYTLAFSFNGVMAWSLNRKALRIS